LVYAFWHARFVRLLRWEIGCVEFRNIAWFEPGPAFESALAANHRERVVLGLAFNEPE